MGTQSAKSTKVPCEFCRGTGKYYRWDGTQTNDCVFCNDEGFNEVEPEKWYDTCPWMIILLVGAFIFIGLQYIFFFPAWFGW